ncbi:hypothetical protein ZIOFF_023365 [Zingiber officinale]|uniref:Uncharacterized protein n=1 Tax=Zingiber officinale TaxID=94328 RepID=A0A8J5GWN1_ZINOF|nr:hypothetical protein ZIOFF_023365 [Zingiber officinale]
MDIPATVMWAYLTVAVTALALASSLVPSLAINYGTTMSRPMLPSTSCKRSRPMGSRRLSCSMPMNGCSAPSSALISRSRSPSPTTSSSLCNSLSMLLLETSLNEATFMKTTFSTLKNIQTALNEASVKDQIKVTAPLNADVYNSPSNNSVPSSGDFRFNIHGLMVDMVRLMHSNDSLFVVNIYNYLSLDPNPNYWRLDL